MRVLLIAPAFYDYHHHIVQEIERSGHSVRFFAERPSRWIYSPAKKLPSKFRRFLFDKYQKNILAAVKNESFDRVLLIRGEIIAPWFIRTLRQRLPQARFVMYQWDSYRVTDFRPLVGEFDFVSTFDPADSKELGINYLPLFHTSIYRIHDEPTAPTSDIVFVGSFHASRYKTLTDVRSYCSANGLRFYHYLYISPIDYYKLKFLSKTAPARNDVEFKKLDPNRIVDLYRNATAILDIENNRQTGLTMRSFEALATGRYLITTNPMAATLLQDIRNRIITIDRNHLKLPIDDIRRPPGWSDDLNAYSIETWIERLLSA